ncbi:hypothetical protein AAGG74_14815 [Bacillus mexicanus]|uniref:hypothetical protein n=1 Tax=Bacillus mexicanus TaxID=2834415 RepID=UPI003D1AA486
MDKNIPKNIKISLKKTINIQTSSFIKKNKGMSLEIYENEDDLIDSLLIYWFINSTKRNYKWLEQKNINMFLNSYSPLIRKELKTVFYKKEFCS